MAKKGVRRLVRKCSTCGKSIRIKTYSDGHYNRGVYWGRLKLPVDGTGEYKKIGISRMFGKTVSIVKWTGKEREVEDWECNGCFDLASHECWLEELLEKLYGKKCCDYEQGCACCQAWSVYDTVIDHNRGRL